MAAMSQDSPSDAPPAPTDAAIVVSAWRSRLVALAMKLVWNRDDAEELAQEALMRAIVKQIPAGDPSYGPWLMRTVANLALNHRRHRKAERLNEAALQRVGGGNEHDRAALQRIERVRMDMAHLPDQQRIALVLRAMEGLEYEAIAEIMEISPAAVRTHVHLARKRLLRGVRTSGPPSGQVPLSPEGDAL